MDAWVIVGEQFIQAPLIAFLVLRSLYEQKKNERADICMMDSELIRRPHNMASPLGRSFVLYLVVFISVMQFVCSASAGPCIKFFLLFCRVYSTCVCVCVCALIVCSW
jgi:hypothetical protein